MITTIITTKARVFNISKGLDDINAFIEDKEVGSIETLQTSDLYTVVVYYNEEEEKEKEKVSEFRNSQR